MAGPRIGIDLGGTKIEGLVLDDEGKECARERLEAPQDSYEDTLNTLCALITKLEDLSGQSGLSVGLSTPGAISPESGLLRNSNSTWLNGKTFVEDLQKRLGRSVRIANDANCFVLSEGTDGAAAGAQVVFGVIVGTGTGGGILVDGKLLTGPHAIAGEWGHNPLPWPEPDELHGSTCYCGKEGCIETFLSGPGMARDHFAQSNQALSAAEIAKASKEGVVAADRTLSRYERRMAKALATVINLIDPDVIVLGGGLSQISRLYDNVPKIWGDYVFSDFVRTKLVPPHYGDSSGVRGAAWLWPKQSI